MRPTTSGNTTTDSAFARALSRVRGALVTARPGLVARYVAPADVDDVPAHEIVCTEGACLHARPGTPCDCRSCLGRDHGARSTLAPAACKGTRMLVEVDPRGGYRYPRCTGCNDCRRPRLVLVGATTRDPFARLPQVDDDAW